MEHYFTNNENLKSELITIVYKCDDDEFTFFSDNGVFSKKKIDFGSNLLIKTIIKHFKTICKHKYYVFNECRQCGITWQGIKHDLSKFGKTEFISSAKYFQGNRSPIDAEKEDCGYSVAWQHHKGHNPHHWEYYLETPEQAAEIPKLNVAEMLLDWIAMSMKFKNSPITWYNQNKDRMILHKKTRDNIERVLSILSMETQYPFRIHKRTRTRHVKK